MTIPSLRRRGGAKRRGGRSHRNVTCERPPQLRLRLSIPSFVRRMPIEYWRTKSMTFRTALLAISLGLTSGTIPLLAHHSFAAEYDANKPISVTGTVTKVEWMNPHARFYVD